MASLVGTKIVIPFERDLGESYGVFKSSVVLSPARFEAMTQGELEAMKDRQVQRYIEAIDYARANPMTEEERVAADAAREAARIAVRGE